MEFLKSLDDLCLPDPRQKFHAFLDRETGQFRTGQLRDLYDELDTITLHLGVPARVRSHFATALNLVAYSWFYYPFNVTAQLLSLVSVEFALKVKYPDSSAKSFKALIKKAIGDGHIRESAFTHLSPRRNDHISKDAAEDKTATIEGEYLRVLIEVLPGMRNSLAHGATSIHGHGMSSVRFCAEFINQLFAQAN